MARQLIPKKYDLTFSPFFRTEKERRNIIFLRINMNGLDPDDIYFAFLAHTAKILGYDVIVVTSNSDEYFCKSMSKYAHVYQVGWWIPKSIFGKFPRAMCGLRTMYACFWIFIHRYSMTPNLIVAHLNNYALPLLKVTGSVPIIQILRYSDEHLVAKMFQRFEPTNSAFSKFCIECANEVIIPNKISRKMFYECFPNTERRAIVIYPCVETFKFLNYPLITLNVIPKDAIFFVQFEAQYLQSNFELTLFAFIELLDTLRDRPHLHESLYMVIIGRYQDNYEYQMYLKRVHYVLQKLQLERNCLIFLQVAPLLYRKAILHRCLAVIQPSLYDMNPRPILEAGMMRKPVIASKTGIAKELIVDGVNGFFLDDDSTEYAKCMYNILLSSKMRIKLSQKTQLRFKTHFGMDKLARELQNIVERNAYNPNADVISIFSV